jgi:ankyrin repeat protein
MNKKTIAHYCKPGISVSQIRDLIQSEADINQPALAGVAVAGATPLILAAYYNLVDVARLLLDAGASIDHVDSSGKTALMRSVEQGSRETTRLLLQHGAILQPDYRLIFAAQMGDGAEVNRLIEEGVSINTRDRGTDDTRGGTPVGWAAAFGQVDVVQRLLSSETPELEAALTLAIIEGHGPVIRLLEEELAGR